MCVCECVCVSVCFCALECVAGARAKRAQNLVHTYIGGWDCESNREIVFVSFVRACVRASGRARRGEAVWACEALFLAGLGCGRSSCAPVCGVCGVSWGSLARWIARLLFFGVYRVSSAPRTPGASRPGLQSSAKRCKSMQIAANRCRSIDRSIDR